MGKQYVWLPYSSACSDGLPLRVESARGCWLFLDDGIKLLDGISSWWSVCHGYSHPYIVEQMRAQLERLSHVMLCSGLIHEQVCKLSFRLANIAPGNVEKVFFSDSGSMAVEVAMKLAVQYWCAMGKSEKSNFVFFRSAYHGDSMGCMSVSDPEAIHGSLYLNYYPKQYAFDLPKSMEEIDAFAERIGRIKDKVAAVVIEPVLQAAGGMKFHSVTALQHIRAIAENNGILFIADEIATGFGRTGAMFACNHAEINPDIMVLGKALSGGYCSLAATLVSDKVCAPFLSDNVKFMHGNTFIANPLACAAANASLDLFEDGSLLKKIGNIETQMKSEFAKFNELDCVCGVRIKGAVAAMDLRRDYMSHLNVGLTEKLTEVGIWLRPVGNVLYIMPPYVISADEL
ncbi:unnamed protein product, partial [Ixodes pacificus]